MFRCDLRASSSPRPTGGPPQCHARSSPSERPSPHAASSDPKPEARSPMPFVPVSPRPMLTLLLFTLLNPAFAKKDKDPEDETPHVGPKVSKRADKRYEDVITTTDGTRWRGKVLERGDTWRILLDGRSEVVVPKDKIIAITRELHPGYLHAGQWGLRATLGFEGGARVAGANAGAPYGATSRITLSRSFGGLLVPELQVAWSPFGRDQGTYSTQAAFGARVYYQEDQRGKPFTDAHIIFAGGLEDIGFRTGTGFQWDVTPSTGLSGTLGVLVLTQDDDYFNGTALAIGLSLGMEGQVRF